MRKEIGIIAHSCGVREPRQLKRFHCRIVQDDSRSVPLNELYPDVHGVSMVQPAGPAQVPGQA